MPAPVPNALLDHHRDNNRATAAGWQDFASHRERLTALIADAAGDGDDDGGAGAPTLALLGAGNCNDVDLGHLASVYREIHLVDLDAEAVQRALRRDGADIGAGVHGLAPVDLSGLYDLLPRLRSKTLSAAELASLPESALGRVMASLSAAGSPPVGAAGAFDTVVSTCCLSQLMHSCYLALGRHAQLDAIAGVLARVHLRTLFTLARPGGHVLLATDMVSSETFPLEEMWDTRPALDLLAELERSGNFLSGTALASVRRLFATDPAVAALADGPPRVIEPWLWRLGNDLSLAVYALAARRRR